MEGKSGAETIQELREDQQRLKQQLQQKDQVLRDTHTNMQTRYFGIELNILNVNILNVNILMNVV